MLIPTIYQDADIIVINKPSGVVVHPFDFSTEKTLLDFLKTQNPEIFLIENPMTLQDGRIINLGGIVHKLDRDTSGLMVIAKKNSVFNNLQQQFQSHTTYKIYNAIVDGVIDKDEFIIDAPLGRNKKDYKQVVNPNNPRGELRDAVTKVKVLTRNKSTTLVELTPKTGRTHQLRAHMSHIGHPITGDLAYGSTSDTPRIMLHAKNLGIEIDGKAFSFQADLPEEFYN
jgi:23S rRNA pseudouridine1911/1915/1917 synthase